MISRHFHANMKVQTAICKDNNNSKSRAATYVKFDIYFWQKHTFTEQKRKVPEWVSEKIQTFKIWTYNI